MQQREVFSVSSLTQLIRGTLEDRFPEVLVEGEVSNFRPSAAGHWYFSLKDEGALLSAVMFLGNNRRTPFQPRDGDLLEVSGSISVYPPRGTYQLIVRRMERAGTGQILQILEERKRAFEAEGLFGRRRALPAVPRRIAVITSPTGAAIRDVIHVLSRRAAPAQVLVVPVPVQGTAAPPAIAAAIRYVNRHALGDVMILTRGGGSLEDLLPFSSEEVVRAVATSETPVISAVGHEVDWALSDYAADARAPTPSAAAEIVSPGSAEILDRARQARDAISGRVTELLAGARRRLDYLSEAELRYRYRNLVQPWYQRLDEALDAIRAAIGESLQSRRTRLAVATSSIEAGSPFLPLERGYVVVCDESTGEIITRREETSRSRPMTAQFSDGTIRIRRVEDE
jgi:exodeoxyribonuclease VII large subunit